jgi:predicted small secreted protein
LKISLFKIGVILSVIGMIWISIVFLQGDKISEEIILESSNSHDVKMNLDGVGISYYKVFMPKFSGEQIFVQILDKNQNIISEESVQTKMSVGYFDFEKSGMYTVKVTNPSKNQINLQVELGDAGSEVMIPPGILILVGAVMIIFSSYMKLKNYKIEQPDKNIL